MTQYETQLCEPIRTLPSGYEQSASVGSVQVSPEVLPWLKVPQGLCVAECRLQGVDKPLYIASAIGTHDRLVAAAEKMTDHQQRIVDNMFYSRLAGFAEHGFSSHVETMPDGITESPIHVMRNQGGLRIYFTQIPLRLPNGTEADVVLRLGVCDKNAQNLVFNVLSAKTGGNKRHYRTK